VKWTHKSFVPRIAKLTAEAGLPITNFPSKCNALETLRKIVEAMIINESESGVGCNIYPLVSTDECVEGAMSTILATMAASERTDLLRIQMIYKGTLWTVKIELLVALCHTRKIRRGSNGRPFPGLGEVLASVSRNLSKSKSPLRPQSGPLSVGGGASGAERRSPLLLLPRKLWSVERLLLEAVLEWIRMSRDMTVRMAAATSSTERSVQRPGGTT
jgi:hypothetical protein